MTHDELKPCPFCGGEAVPILAGKLDYFRIYCRDCKASTKPREYREAIAAWNRRAE